MPSAAVATIHSLTAPDGRTWIAVDPLACAVARTNRGWEAALDEVGLLAYAPTLDALPAALGAQFALLWDAVCIAEAWWAMEVADQIAMTALTARFVLVQAPARRPVARRVPRIECRLGCAGGNACSHSMQHPYTGT